MWAGENLEKKNKHISHIQLGHSLITYKQFRALIERNKLDDTALATFSISPGEMKVVMADEERCRARDDRARYDERNPGAFAASERAY